MMMLVAITACAVCLVIALIRTMLGPTAFDRVLAVNAIGTLIILGIALHGAENIFLQALMGLGFAIITRTQYLNDLV